MSLQQTPFLFIDCQTTGMHPSIGDLLEISWCISSSKAQESEIKSRIIRVDEIPRRVREITGIDNNDLVNAVEPELVRKEFLDDISANDFSAAVIHYAQFEKAFLLDFLQLEELPFKVLCTHAISKRLFPNVPSRNIRALSGFFGAHFTEVKRSEDHLRATLEIWKKLSAELEKNELYEINEIEKWLQNIKAKKPTKYEYNIDREWRLALPSSPGVYRMFAKNGEILYVGKATSLKDRVNSYFRGMKGREKRKLEMIAQAHKIEVTECASALEAALLETDEIKKHNPPYNVALKDQNKYLIYYSHDFSSKSDWVDGQHTIGPFRKFNAIEDLKVLARWQQDGDSRGVFYDLLSHNELREGFTEFALRWPQVESCTSIRAHLALGEKILRALARKAEEKTSEADADDFELELESSGKEANEVLSPTEVADKFERAYARAAHTLNRARRITRLLNSEVKWIENGEWKSLKFQNGKVSISDSKLLHTAFSTQSWVGLGVSDYDRMSVLDTALRKTEKTIL